MFWINRFLPRAVQIRGKIMTQNNIDTTIDTNFATQSGQSLRQNAKEALQKYFEKLGGAKINDLYNMVLSEIEEPLLRAIMSYTRGNQSKAAIFLGISRGTLRKKLKIYGMLGSKDPS
jgi:Fis family transcriptional regulator